ncbi:AmpG family muropeptide MFS transporter [Chitinimonas sp. BJB300]|uniref:AmpG family muropeptide MFS transporter n=1 Tax=Chitinimonas sp. BJB300 TaxID=1559339 RepID=UPI000C11E4C8|nr:MFS transporter [Chitinimonas sp. BJB300]PHV12347.1 muropeptide transporter AmpG [Chitinimonas sp. BJB300]TSJ91057.1 MFS transporter [Chitinimonas sp. BJB300]
MALAHYLTIFGNRRVAASLGLGFASGLPLALTAGSLQAWLTVTGLDIATIGYFALIGQPYTYKFLWSPLLDRFEPPFLGHRRGWLLITQLLLAAAIFAMSLVNPVVSPGLLAGFGVAVAFLSASQDIAYDAYRTELLQDDERGAGAAVGVLGYRLAMLVSGAFALIIAERQLGWPGTYRLIAAIMAGMAIVTLLSPKLALPDKPASPAGLELKGFVAMLLGGGLGFLLARNGLELAGIPTEGKGWGLVYLVGEVMLAGALAIWAARWVGFPALTGPLDEFLSRRSAWMLLALIVLYKLGDAFAGSLTTTFLLRGVGFSQTEVGEVNKVFGLIATLVGALVGGLWMARLGLWRALLLFGILQAVSNLMYWLLAVSGKSYGLMVLAVGVENFCGGMGSTAFVALLMALCHAQFTATQFALLSALAAFGRVYVGPASGVMVEAFGWPNFFLTTVLTALPGLVLLLVLRNQIMGLYSVQPLVLE